MKENIEMHNIVLLERIPEKICAQNEIIVAAERDLKPRPKFAAYSGPCLREPCRGCQNCPSETNC